MYRKLKPGELMQLGDEIWMPAYLSPNGWVPITTGEVGHSVTTMNTRRPIDLDKGEIYYEREESEDDEKTSSKNDSRRTRTHNSLSIPTPKKGILRWPHVGGSKSKDTERTGKG